MKNVLMLLTNHFMPDARVLKEAESLVSAGYNVTIRCFYQQGLLQKENINGVNVERVIETPNKEKRRNFLQKFFFLFIFFYSFQKKTNQYDIIHCHDVMPYPIAVWIKWKHFNRPKLVYDCHEYETEVYRPNKKYYKLIYKLIEWLLIRFSDSVITVSDSIAKEYVRLYNIKKPYLILNCPSYNDYENKNLLRERFNISKDTIVFVYQGGLSRGRGIENMLDAFEQLNDPKKSLVLIGGGQLLDRVKLSVNKNKNIFYIPTVPQSELLDLTASADIGILNYQNTCLNHYYCSPNKLFEYTMANVPILANDLYEISRIISKYNNGFIIKEESVSAIYYLIKTIDFQQVENAKKNISEMKKIYCWEEQEKNLLRLYTDLKQS